MLDSFLIKKVSPYFVFHLHIAIHPLIVLFLVSHY